MSSPLHSLSSQLVRRWKHIDPPGLWSSVFAGSAIVHLLVLGVTSRISIESTATNPDLVVVDLVELPLENPPVTPTPTPFTPNPSPVFPSGNLSNNSPTPPPSPAAEPSPEPTPVPSPTPPPSPAVEPSPEPTPTPSPTPPPSPAAEPSPEPTPTPSPTPPPSPAAEPSPEPTPTPSPTPPPTQPEETPTDNSAGEDSEPTGGNSVSITLTNVTGTAIYEGSCASSVSQNFTICPDDSISASPPAGECNGQFAISALIDDSISPSRGTILQLDGVRRANGENASELCTVWLENLIRDWKFQPRETSAYFTSAFIEISIAIDGR